MADELKMVRGEGLWQNKYNRLVDTVEKMGGVLDGLQWSDRTDTGIVLPAGLKFDDQHWYTYAKIGNRTVCHLHLGLKVTGDIQGTITLPDSAKPWAPIQGLANDHTWWAYFGAIDFHQLANQRKLAANDLMLVDAMYTVD
ncbi:hypothetical protein [Clostridium faecium]|uniref:Uncharacterized protein n=1 Tax=Clostridium faecium TaxID=2762223 RepID=A0ABR8YWB1_9CLOT|nr:hypothetical protein [Clostridium faecium]MBD8048525.1 hypothetical protein [Clostridium faecium]